MADSLTHRGPDGGGVWIDNSHTIGLAHRRLAIVDRSPNAAQPMISTCNRAVITYNGEIYNHQELRKALLNSGYRFKTDHSDTEVVLNGYLAWGMDELLNRLDGMFAFCLWDKTNKTLFAARDKVGIKPLYFHSNSKRFAFASEIKPLLLSPDYNKRINQHALGHFLSFMSPPAPLTLFNEIYKLPAAHYLILQPGLKLRVTKYWNALSGAMRQQEENAQLERSELEAKTRNKLTQSVSKRLMSDVPVGVFLSSGVDSTTIATLATAAAETTVHTFSIGFSDHAQFNETELAMKTAKKLGTNHHEVLISQQEMLEFTRGQCGRYDVPTSDWSSMPIHFLSSRAQANNVPVILSGEGADEMFLGYPLTLRYQQLEKHLWNPYRALSTPRFRNVVAKYAKGAYSPHPLTEKIREFLVRSNLYSEPYWGNSNALWEVQKSKVRPDAPGPASDTDQCICDLFDSKNALSSNSGDVIDSYVQELSELKGTVDFGLRASLIDLRYRLPELLLARLDLISMGNSIEGRVPFLDSNLIEFSLSLSTTDKAPGGNLKGLLKSSLSDILPDEIQERPKTGFRVPIANWLRDEFGRMAMERIRQSHLFQSSLLNIHEAERLYQDHLIEKNDCSVQLWNLYALTSWAEMWEVTV